MKCEIGIQFVCGEKTCAVKKGIFCYMFKGGIFGRCTCELFGDLGEKDGWVQRHADCLKEAKEI